VASHNKQGKLHPAAKPCVQGLGCRSSAWFMISMGVLCGKGILSPVYLAGERTFQYHALGNKSSGYHQPSNIHSRLKSPGNHTCAFMYLWLMLGWRQETIASHNCLNIPVWLRELFKRKCTIEKARHSREITSPLAPHKMLEEDSKGKLRQGRANLIEC